MSKLNQIKIPVNIEDSRPTPNYKLVREHDGLEKYSQDVLWIEWDETGHFKERHPKIEIGRSLMMSPFHFFHFTWQTTPVTEIVEQREDYIKFKTENSTYELFKI